MAVFEVLPQVTRVAGDCVGADGASKLLGSTRNLWQCMRGLADSAEGLVVIELSFSPERIEAAVTAREPGGAVVTLFQVGQVIIPRGKGHGAKCTLCILMKRAFLFIMLLESVSVGQLNSTRRAMHYGRIGAKVDDRTVELMMVSQQLFGTVKL